jgi:hypothetical protein
MNMHLGRTCDDNKGAFVQSVDSTKSGVFKKTDINFIEYYGRIFRFRIIDLL